MKLYNIYIFIAAALLLASCTHDHSAHDGHDHGSPTAHDHGAEDGHTHTEETGEIHLTQEQINTMKIQFGDFSAIKINDYVKATGSLGLPPNALSSVSAKSNGFIQNSNKYVEGSYVKKGVVMAYLENPEFIQLQQAYLETAAELKYAEQELERQQTLVAASAGVEKNLQKLEAEVAVKKASLMGVSKRLSYLGIGVNKLTPENIVQRIPIYAPISGYITSIQIHDGLYVTPELELMEIVDEEHLHLELDVFEQDIAKIKEEQAISYTVPALGNKVYQGDVHVIGKEFNTANKTVRIHGHLDNERPQFIKDLFIDAKIWLNDQTVQALPEGAVIKDGAFYYIFASMKNTEAEVVFEKYKVVPGQSDKGYIQVELIDPLPKGMQIVTQGAYYVYAQSKAGELEHNH